MPAPARYRRTLKQAGRDLAMIEGGIRMLFGPTIAAGAALQKLQEFKQEWEKAKLADLIEFDDKEEALDRRFAAREQAQAAELRNLHAFDKTVRARIKEQLADLASKQTALAKASKAMNSRGRLHQRVAELEHQAEELAARHARELEMERRNYSRALDLLGKVPRGTPPAV